MTFQVVVTARAEHDLMSIGDWLHERSPEGAQSWTTAAWEAIDGLGTKARYCPLASEDAHSDREVRNVLFHTRRGRVYRAVFIIEDDLVVVTHLRGPRQDVLSASDLEDTLD